MKTKKILSLLITLMMIMSTISIPVTADAAGTYYLESHTTTGNWDYLNVNLDDIFTTGETYKIRFNAKPQNFADADYDNSLNILVSNGSLNADASQTIIRLVSRVFSGKSYHYTYVQGNSSYVVDDYEDAIVQDGLDVEMIWDTETGTITGDVYFGGVQQSITYEIGTVGEGQTYGNLKIGAGTTKVTVSNLSIEKDGAPTPEPTDSYYLESYTTTGNWNYLDVNLDDIFTTGETYKIRFNAKPENFVNTNSSNSLNILVSNGSLNSDATDTIARLFYNYGYYYYNVKGNSSTFAADHVDAIVQDGLDVEMTWDTETGIITGDVYFDNVQQSITYEIGTVGEGQTYGNLKIGAGSTKVTVSNLSIEKKVAEPTGSYYLESYTTTGNWNYLDVNLDDIFATGETYKISFNAKPENFVNTNSANSLNILVSNGSLNSDATDTIVRLFYNYNLYYFNVKGNSSTFAADYVDAIVQDGLDVEMIWDTETGIITGDVYFDNVQQSITYEIGTVGEGQTYGNLKIGAGSTKVTVSNLSIEKNVATIDPTEVDNVEVLVNGYVQEMDAVHPAADIVKIYFSAPINTDYVTADNFKINDGAVSWQDSYIRADNCVVLSLTDTLTPGTTYTISISDDVLDSTGAAITAYETSFTTTEGEITGGDDGLVDKGHNELVYADLLTDDFSTDTITGTSYWSTGDGHTVADGVLTVSGYEVAEVEGTASMAGLYLDINKLLEAKNVTDAKTVKFEVDINYDASNLGSVYLWEDDAAESTVCRSKFFAGSSGGFVWNKDWNGNALTAENTYRLSVEYDLVTNNVIASLKNGTTDLATLNGAAKLVWYPSGDTSTMTSLGGFAFGDYQNVAIGKYDNLKVSYSKEIPSKPELTAENVTLYTAMEDEVTDWSNVTPTVKTVAIDFERSMDIATLSDATVYVTKKDDTTHIPALLSYAEGVASLIFTGSILDAGTYTINVSGAVENINDVALGEDFAVDFTVTTGKCEAEIATVKANNNSVFGVADITTGSKVTVAVDYSNATGNAQDLSVIFATYKGEEMSYVEVYDANGISADITGMTYKPVFTAPDMTGVTEVQIMVWNGWDTLMPLAPVVEIK